MTDYYKEFVEDREVSIPGGVGGSPGYGPKKEPRTGPYLGMEGIYQQQVGEGEKEVQALRELNVERPPAPTMTGQFIQGVENYRRSADRSLEYMFGADKARKAELRELAGKEQLVESRRPAAYQVGREILPWLTPGAGAKKLPMQMLESGLTSFGLDVLDFNKQPTTGGMTANAAGAALAPLATRGISRLSPVGTPGAVSRSAVGAANPARGARLWRLKEKGYLMTPSEVSGSPELRRAERQMLKNRRRGPGVAKQFNKLTEHNRKISNKIVIDALGLPPVHTSLSEEALGSAHRRIKSGLEDIVQNARLKYDAQFNKDLHKLKGTYSDPELKRMLNIDPDATAELDRWIKDASINRQFSGKAWQGLEERHRKQADSAFHSGSNDLGRVHLGVAEALDDLMERQLGIKKLGKYKELKQQYAVSEMVSGDRYKDMVDKNGDINPKKVAMDLERKRSVRKLLNRGGKYSPLDVIRDYAKLSETKELMPLEGSKGIIEDVINLVPELGGGSIPGWMYLKAGARLPLSEARKSAAGQVGTYLGGRAGGTEMESALWNSIIGGQGAGGVNLIPALQSGVQQGGQMAGNILSGGGSPFWGGP